MLISHRKRFIYTKTAKTAGTSVECYFEPYCLPEGSSGLRQDQNECVTEAGIIGYRGPRTEAKNRRWRNHMSAAEIRNEIGDSIWQSYFKFCVIRDPFDKLVSAFYFRERQKEKTASLHRRFLRFSFKPMSRDCDGAADVVARFRHWVRNGGSVIDRNTYVIDGQICVDYFIRFEQLSDGIRHICERLDIPFEPAKIPRLKSGIRSGEIPLHAYYDAETVEIVKTTYKFEIETFGYKAPTGTSG